MRDAHLQPPSAAALSRRPAASCADRRVTRFRSLGTPVPFPLCRGFQDPSRDKILSRIVLQETSTSLLLLYFSARRSGAPVRRSAESDKSAGTPETRAIPRSPCQAESPLGRQAPARVRRVLARRFAANKRSPAARACCWSRCTSTTHPARRRAQR